MYPRSQSIVPCVQRSQTLVIGTEENRMHRLLICLGFLVCSAMVMAQSGSIPRSASISTTRDNGTAPVARKAGGFVTTASSAVVAMTDDQRATLRANFSAAVPRTAAPAATPGVDAGYSAFV